jgi:tRNA(Ile)-lysidine synthase
MSRPFDLAEEVRRQLEAHAMLAPGGRCVAAVSGGADSTALLLALHDAGSRPVVAHLDHGLRPESAADAGFVGELAGRLGLRAAIERRDVEAHRRRRKESLEAAAREVRHAFLREVAEREGAAAIFLAHTADDQVETFLLRLIRGAGPAGLGGMRFKDGLLCRPLLGTWRTDVEVFLRRRGQGWHEDASNQDRRFLRNRVRHELLPLLASMNPGIRQVLLREAATLAHRQDEVEAEVLRRLGLSSRQIGAALADDAVTIAGGWRLERLGSRPAWFPAEGSLLDAQGGGGVAAVELPVPGEVELPGIGRVLAEPAPLARAEAGAWRELIDADRVDGSLRVRTRRRGDRFMPLGMTSEKKLQDFFVDAHVPRQQRDSIPLIVDDRAIVWVAGMRLDERFKISARTRRAVRLRFVPSAAS